MFFPQRRLVCLTVDPDGDTLRVRRFLGKENDATFTNSIGEMSKFEGGYRMAVIHDVLDVLKMDPPKAGA